MRLLQKLVNLNKRMEKLVEDIENNNLKNY